MESYKDPMLARELIIERYDNPINRKKPNDKVDGYKLFNNKSESCIDNLTVYLNLKDNKVIEGKFEGIGCAISTASTDILCELIKNKTYQESKVIIDNYRAMINGEPYDENIVDKLIIFRNISKQLNRVKCALNGCVSIQKILEEENDR